MMKQIVHAFQQSIEGPSKDLNYAIKTNSKKVNGLILTLAEQSATIPTDSLPQYIDQLFSLAATLDLSVKRSYQTLNSISQCLMKFSQIDKNVANLIYQCWADVACAINLSDKKEIQMLYQWLFLLSQDNPPVSMGNLFEQIVPQMLEFIDKLLPLSNKVIISHTVQSHENYGLTFIELIIDSYYYQQEAISPCMEAVVIKLIKTHHQFGNEQTLSILQRSPRFPSIAAELVDHFVKNTTEADDLWEGIGGSLFYELTDSGGGMTSNLLEKFILALTSFIDDWDEKETQRAYIYFIDEIRLNQWGKKSKSLNNLLGRLSNKNREKNTTQRFAVLSESPGYKLPKDGLNQFEDINFKLTVLEQLMFEKKLLCPIFNLVDFIRAYDHRIISLDDEWDDIIPEAMSYFKGLRIPQNLLDTITVLDAGFYRGGAICQCVFPGWHGEDGRFFIKSLVDVKCLPNLKQIHGLEKSIIRKYLNIRDNIELQAWED